jgi:hypothetical protein
MSQLPRYLTIITLATTAIFGVAVIATPATALACGDTPGFCANPPDPTWPVGTSGDF